MLARYWSEYVSQDSVYPGKVVLVDPTTNLDDLPKEHPWLNEEKLVVKPDQLFGKRGKLGLIKANASFDEVKEWLQESRNTEFQVGRVADRLTRSARMPPSLLGGSSPSIMTRAAARTLWLRTGRDRASTSRASGQVCDKP